MSTERPGCRFPENAPRTAYDKGCRCVGCVERERERKREWWREKYRTDLEWAEWERERQRARWWIDDAHRTAQNLRRSMNRI